MKDARLSWAFLSAPPAIAVRDDLSPALLRNECNTLRGTGKQR